MPGSEQAGRLLLTIHHLSIDGVSWRILVPDLASAWQAIANGQEPALPAKGSSFRRFAQRLAAHAQHPDRFGELPFWTGMQSGPALSLVDGALDPQRDVSGTAGHVMLTLPSALTEALLTRVPAAFHGGINDVLLTGLALAVADWCRRHDRGAHSGHSLTVAAPVCGAAGSGGSRPRGDVRGPRSVAHGRLVHQPVPGAA